MVFTITTRADAQLIGAVGLREIDTEHCQAEMGFWIGVEWWGRGYVTEAAKKVIAYAFQELKLNRIYAHHMVRNPASGRVLEKVGNEAGGTAAAARAKMGRVRGRGLAGDSPRRLEKKGDAAAVKSLEHPDALVAKVPRPNT